MDTAALGMDIFYAAFTAVGFDALRVCQFRAGVEPHVD